MTKRAQREHIFKMLFRKDFHEPADLFEQTEFYLSALEEAEDGEKKMLQERLQVISEKQGEVDVLLANATSGWRLETPYPAMRSDCSSGQSAPWNTAGTDDSSFSATVGYFPLEHISAR